MLCGVEEVNVGRWRKHQFGQAAVGHRILHPAGRIVIEQTAQRDRQSRAVTDHEYPLSLMTVVDLPERDNDAARYGCQSFTAGWREVRIRNGAGDEIVFLGEMAESQTLPLANGIFGETFHGHGIEIDFGGYGCRRLPASFEGAGIDGAQIAVRCRDVTGRSPGLPPAAPGQRTVGGAMPEPFDVGFDLGVPK